jgi:hypothetical protein
LDLDPGKPKLPVKKEKYGDKSFLEPDFLSGQLAASY